VHDIHRAPDLGQQRRTAPRRRARAASAALLIALLAGTLAGPGASLAADNLPPVAVDDPGAACGTFSPWGGAFPIPEDWGAFAFSGGCSAVANDVDPDGTIVAWQVVTPPAHGSLVWLDTFPDAFSYTPDPDFSTAAGDWISDSFEYVAIDDAGATSNVATMRFWVAAINDPPSFLTVPDVSVERDSGSYDADWLPFVSAGAANESDQAVAFAIDAVDTNGVPDLFSEPPAFTADGHLTFTPAEDKEGLASVTVHLQDDGGLEDYGIPLLPVPPDDTSDAVTFTITVAGGNHDPLASDDGDPFIPIGRGAGPVPIDVLANDTSGPDEGETLTITAVSQGANGSVAIAPGGLRLTYDPSGNTTGTDTFTYTISDGNGGSDVATVNVDVERDTTAPVTSQPGFVAVETVSATRVRVTVNWTAQDPESGVASSLLQVRRVGGDWSNIPLDQPTARQGSAVLLAGRTYEFRVRSTNGATPSKTSDFEIGPPISA
jgi:hypothetical protein